MTLSHKGARGGAPVLRAGERGEGWRPAFSWCSVVSYRAPPPKGEHKGEASADSALPGAAPRTAQSGGQGGAEPAPHAGAPWTADPHHCERRFLRLIPTSMKTAPAGPPAGLLFWPLAGQLQPGSLPSFGSSPPHPLPFSPPQLPGRPAAFQGFRLGHLDAQRGAAPLIWGRGRINPRVCREGWGRGVKSKRGLQIGPPLLV